MTELLELRGNPSPKKRLLLVFIGGVLIFGCWWVVSFFGIVPTSILPSPWRVITSFKELHFEDALVRNAFFSLKINAIAYVEATAFALPLGFLIGLTPLCGGMFERYIAVARYLPLTAAIGIFIAWFGIGDNMKVQFLAFGIFVYLLPTVAQRVAEVEQIYVDTVRTVGATRWQTVRSVFIPAVVSRVFTDIKNLVPLSWTYVVVTETINSSAGGMGALSYIAGRQSRVDKAFAVLVAIMLIGFLQDKILEVVDRALFKHKYV